MWEVQVQVRSGCCGGTTVTKFMVQADSDESARQQARARVGATFMRVLSLRRVR